MKTYSDAVKFGAWIAVIGVATSIFIPFGMFLLGYFVTDIVFKRMKKHE